MAAGADKSAEQVVLELPSVRYNKRNGMLLLTSRRIAWAEELSPEYKITHEFCEIKSTNSIRFLFMTRCIQDFNIVVKSFVFHSSKNQLGTEQ